MKIRPKLTELLKQKGWTQMKLSEVTGIPQGSISRFDTNKRHDDYHLFAISKALGLTIEELFEVTE
ncbi:helix-turn-helix domain-containing protein [Paenibacillus dokdonensis]|uniref:helix-turn-helix domain-containing protein n=1 Tax=Paenibacillus dokdonensis TaxID=2567944 RepID=UPI001B3C5A41|nr:helix-turn-helix transcriptional regulator [Paenibacillus dokdonensis]